MNITFTTSEEIENLFSILSEVKTSDDLVTLDIGAFRFSLYTKDSIIPLSEIERVAGEIVNTFVE